MAYFYVNLAFLLDAAYNEIKRKGGVEMILSAVYSEGQAHKHRHYHDCYQILYVVKGSAQVEVGGQLHQVQAGSLLIFSRLEQHSVNTRSVDYCRYVLEISPQISADAQFSPKMISVLVNRPEGFSNCVQIETDGGELKRLLHQIVEERQSTAVLSEEMQNLLLQQLLIQIHRRLPQPMPELNDESFTVVHQIQKRFEHNFNEPITLAELAKDYGLSASYVSHIFKKITGHSVMGYLQSCRLAAAKKYLAGTSKSIGEIVDSCGFSDSSNFSRTFKEQVGCTPSEFRKRYKNI